MRTRMLLILLGLLIASQTQVHAYTDPGSGTLIWQMLLAASFGVMFYFRRIIRWVRGLRSDREKASSIEDLGTKAEKESESVNGQAL